MGCGYRHPSGIHRHTHRRRHIPVSLFSDTQRLYSRNSRNSIPIGLSLIHIFKDTFFIREVKNKGSIYQNVCIKMYNENGVQAISQRNEAFKGILGGKFDCLATSNHDKSRPIDILYIGESFIDCISHYQICHSGSDLNRVYVSSEGTFTE